MTITEEFMEEYLETVGFDLFEFEDGWRGKFEKKFSAWAEAEAEMFYEEHPGNASMIERFMKDESEGGSIANFVNSLNPADQKTAIEGMMGLLVRDEMGDSELHTQLAAML